MSFLSENRNLIDIGFDQDDEERGVLKSGKQQSSTELNLTDVLPINVY